jgi:subtilisin-like proprotein convertase family protein
MDDPEIPVGMERVLVLAASDPEFRRALLADPERCLQDRGYRLRPTELRMLRAVPPGALQATIDRIDTSPDNVGRRALLGTMAAGLATLGLGGDFSRLDRITEQIQWSSAAPAAPGPRILASAAIAREGRLLERLGVYLEIETSAPGRVRVQLRSPSGTEVLLLDGAANSGVRAGGIRGWYGYDGLPTAAPLAPLSEEPVSGRWQLRIQAPAAATLRRWRLSLEVSPDTRLASWSPNGPYGIRPDPPPGQGGCNCEGD